MKRYGNCMLLLAILAALGSMDAALAEGNGGIAITNANFEGTSPERENLNTEWIEISNAMNETVDMTGWTLSDAQNHAYTFGEFKLPAGASVTVHTGKGDDGATDLFWGSGKSIWNNGGDLATLADASGKVVDIYPDETAE